MQRDAEGSRMCMKSPFAACSHLNLGRGNLGECLLRTRQMRHIFPNPEPVTAVNNLGFHFPYPGREWLLSLVSCQVLIPQPATFGVTRTVQPQKDPDALRKLQELSLAWRTLATTDDLILLGQVRHAI
jgi:hypothetical protein